MNRALWYVLHCKPRKEALVHSQLTVKSIETFYPTITIKPINPRASKIRSFFPGYLFVSVDLAEIGINALQWIPGVNKLVQMGGCPAVVPGPVISELKHRLYYIEAAGGFAFDELRQGDLVKITSGPLAGYDAMFDMRLSSDDRVRLLLKISGRSARVIVNAGAIEKKKHAAR